MESQFTSPFWSYYIIAIVVASFLGILWLLFSQNKVKTKGKEVETMGHSWDGIEEYNNPLPRWWFWMFLGTILFAIGYFIAFPALGDFKGLLGWTSHKQYDAEVAKAEATYKPLYQKYAAMPVEQVAQDKDAMAIGKNLFDTYCIQCHGSDAKGSRGFPNLTDSDWLYGGTPDKIHESIANGRLGVMAAWGPILGEDGVRDTANYVMSLSGKEHNAEAAARGKTHFDTNCVACHGADGRGTLGMAPNLTDDTWLWGGTEKAISETITVGRNNQMPTWSGFLGEEKLHLLTSYVWGLSHPDGKALPTDNGAAAAAAATTAPAATADAASAAASATEAESAATPAPAAPASDKASVTFANGVLNVYFAVSKADVAKEAADVAVDVVKAGKEGKKLVVSGYTDSTGNAAANAALSKKRAQAVQAFLVAQGVPESNIELRKPENTNGAQGNSAEGRRVEVRIE